jgi:predicted secreted protein
MLVLREHDTDGKHEVSVGDRIEIRFSKGPMSGQSWQMEGSLSCFSIVHHHIEPPNTQTLGPGGQEVWELEATVPGEDKIIFECRRSWERDRPPIRRFSATIRVLASLPPR